MNSLRILILGSGPCGLGAAYRLWELGKRDFRVYEQTNHVGGLATSFTDLNGFVWDIGGHVIHSHYAYFDEALDKILGTDYHTHQRSSWVWIFGRFVPYPLQNNIHYLPVSVMRQCLRGLRQVAKLQTSQPRHFRSWIETTFGAGIARHFLLPLNRKQWAYPLDRMDYQWVADRVAQVNLNRIERNLTHRRDDASWGPNRIFRFPKRGGTGEIWRRMAGQFSTRISLNKSVVRINAKKKMIEFSDGTTDRYDVLLSTIPLLKLVGMLHGAVFPNVAAKLHYSSVTIVGLGVAGETPPHLLGKSWMYFPEPQTPFFRATVFSNYAKQNAPAGTWSLMFEVSSSRYQSLPKGDIDQAVIGAAQRAKLMRKSDKIVSRWVYPVEYGYPTPTLGRDEYLSLTLPWLEQYDVYSRGRFGAWKYEVSNQDHTFMQGVEWVNRILLDQTETTLNHPNQVNRRRVK